MQHLEDIKALLNALQQSDTFHALVIESPPGWAKSSTIERILTETNTSFVSLGSYSTPLGLYNSICKSPNGLLVLDDCAGLFGEPTAMSVLKSATWASAGTAGGRKLSWSSSSEKVFQPSVVFGGKLILLTNSVPAGKEVQAFLSRTLYLKLSFDVDEVEKMLLEATCSREHYPDQNLATSVVQFILANAQKYDLKKLNLRTLKMGYEIAKSNPEAWQSLLDRLLPQVSPQDILRSLADSELSTEEQSREFARTTGLSRRTFYYYKQGKAPNRNEPNSPEVYRTQPSASCTDAKTVTSVTPPIGARDTSALQDGCSPL